MPRIFKYKIKDIFMNNKYILLFNLWVFLFMSSLNVRNIKLINGEISEYIISCLIDHYYVLYCMLPILIIITSKYIKSIRYDEKIRYKSIYCHVRKEVLGFIIWFIIYIFIHVILLCFLALLFFDKFSSVKLIEIRGYDELIFLLTKYLDFFGNNILAILSIIGYYIFGVSVFICLLEKINSVKGYKFAIKISLLIFFVTFIGFKTNLSKYVPILWFNNYILFHHALFVNGAIKFLIVLIFGMSLSMYCLGFCQKKFFRRKILDKLTFPRKYKFIMVGFVYGLVFVGLLKGFSSGKFNIDYFILTIFGGNSLQHKSFVLWSKINVIYMLPLLFIAISMSKIKNYRELPIFVRYKNKACLDYAILINYSKALITYFVAMFFVFCIALSFKNNCAIQSGIVLEGNIVIATSTYINFCCIFLLQLFFNFVVFYLICELVNETFGFIFIIIYSYGIFLISELNIFDMNLGIFQYSELLAIDKEVFYFRILLMFLTVVSFYVYAIYKNNKSKI